MVSEHRCAIMLISMVQVEPQSLKTHFIAFILPKNRQNIHNLDPYVHLMIDPHILLPFPRPLSAFLPLLYSNAAILRMPANRFPS